jgi:outer membrane murein-binding lipoprotein Lpp
MNKVLLPAALAASMLLAACGSTGDVAETASAGSDLKTQYEKALKEAESAYKAVDQVGGAWAYTEEKMDEAKKAAETNDFAKALQLAKEAYDESMIAKQQFEGQVNAGPYLF